ncbi:DUF1385 domain-containing protein [Candidatus Peregrinibacteria bacterium]|nr:DUF1385 domain-containing protein [Candidatus Peregrinibacteria bacterium]
MNFRNLNVLVLNWLLILAAPVDAAPKAKIDFAVGGQAVIEGVMMRSPRSLTIAVRKPDKKIKVKKDHHLTICQKYPKLNIPIVRGVINLFEMMIIGTKAINWSANESIRDEEEHSDDSSPKINKQHALEKHEEESKSKLSKFYELLMFSLSLALAIGFSLFLFKFVPLGITSLIDKNFSTVHENFLFFNFIDGTLKATIFLTYIWLLSLIPSFRRVFEYHGAEHKSIFTYENKLDLKVENAKKQTRFHPRCGTSFIIIVFIISIFAYTLLPKQDTFIENFLLRVTFLPLVAGLSYEALKISAKYSTSAFVKPLIAPGLAFQRLTTKEPKDGQLEVGLESLKAALEMEKQI